jgi:hypothetical protein
MGSEWVDGGPSLGSALGGMFGQFNAAPGKALDQMALADKIAWDRRTKLANIQASQAADAAIPQASVPPRRYTAADIATPAVLDAPLSTLKPPSSALETLTPGSGQIIDPRELAQAQAQRNLAVKGTQATLLDHPELWAPQLGVSRVASRGPGATPYDRAEDIFLTTGRYPTGEESKLPPAQNFTVVNADGSPTGKIVSTRDGRTTLEGDSLASVLQPGQRLAETGSAAPVPALDENAAKQRLAIIANNSKGRDLTPDEQFTINTLAPIAYKASRVVEEHDGVKNEKYVHTEEIPPGVVEMMARAGMMRGPATSAPAATTAPGTLAPPSSAVAPAITNLAAAAPAPGAEGPVAPIVPAAAAAAAFNPNASRVTSVLGADPTKIHDDVVKSKPVVQYLNSIGSYNAVVTAATQPPTNATDLNIIYGLAKILDPESAVLGGELKLAASTGTIGQQIKAQFSKLYTDKGTLDAETRANLVEQARVRMQQYNEGKEQVVNYYANEVAPRLRVDPRMAVPPMPEMKEFTREQIIKAAGGTSTPRTAGRLGARPAPTAPAAPAATPAETIPAERTAKDIIQGR